MAFWKKRKPKVYPTHMVVGLGNPGAGYKGTRHNVGFDVIDRLAQDHNVKVTNTRNQALIGEGQISGVEVLLVKPLTFMNLSGRAVKPLAQKYNIKPENILVIADDLDMETGRVRMKPKGSAGGHNGHKSLIQSLGTQEYPRLKIGIGKGSAQTKDHVLSRFHPEEKAEIQEAIELSALGTEIWLTEGIERAMNRVNGS